MNSETDFIPPFRGHASDNWRKVTDQNAQLKELLRLIVVEDLKEEFDLTVEESLVMVAPISGWEHFKHLQEAAKILTQDAK